MYSKAPEVGRSATVVLLSPEAAREHIEAAVVAEVGRAVGAVIEQGAIEQWLHQQPLGLLNLPDKLTKPSLLQLRR